MRNVVAPLRYVSMNSEKLKFTPYDSSAEMSVISLISSGVVSMKGLNFLDTLTVILYGTDNDLTIDV